MKKDTYLVEGMTCSACERAIQKVVGNLEGVSSSKANLQSSSLRVEYDPSVVSIDKISSAIKSIGYKFVGQLPSPGQKKAVMRPWLKGFKTLIKHFLSSYTQPEL